MEREWREIAMRRTRELVADWRDAMSAMRRRHDRLVADGLWVGGPSDFLGIIDQARAENTHSRMLAWLLNPTRRHGLGFGLVRRLLEHCSGEPVPAAPAVRTVKFFEWRHDREADLVVWGEDFTLIIENKVDADEQPDQCDDLYENFKNESAPLFLFLTPDGRAPCTATTPGAKRAFRTVSWPEVGAMIDASLHESRFVPEATGAVDVVENYLRTVKEQFR
jgi:hypothetical protein